MQETINKNIEIDKIKTLLNPKFSLYIEERLNFKWKENSKKEDFLNTFSTLTLEEKKIYREYVYQIINPENWMNSTDIPQISKTRSMDRLEIYAWVCNNCV